MRTLLHSFIAKTLFIIVLTLASSASFGQATFNSNNSGNWTSTNSWTVASGFDSDGIPDSNDAVHILGSDNITVNTGSQACASLIIGATSGNNNTSTLTFSSGTTLTVDGTVSLGNAGGTNRRGAINMTNGGTLVCEGFGLLNSVANTFTYGAGTVNLTATNTLPATIFTTFNDLNIISGTTTTAASLTVKGDLAISSGAIFTTGASNSLALSVDQTTSVTGTLTLDNTATKTFTGNVTINSGGTWNETDAASIAYDGSLQNNGIYTANTGTHTFTGTNKTISGSAGVSISRLTISDTTTNSTTLTVSTTLAGTSTLTNAATGILNYGGTSITPTLNATAAGNIVNYNGAGQNVKNTTYSNLALSGSDTKSFSGNLTIGANLSISGTASADFNNGSTSSTAATLTLGGYGQNSGTWGGTGSGAANINTTYFDNSTGRITVGSGSCTSGVWLGTASTNWNTAANWCGGIPTASTNVIIPSGTAFQPTIATSTTAVCNDIAINSGATLTMANSATSLLNISGDFTNNGTLTAGAASIVSFLGSSAAVLGGTSTTAFANLTINTTTSAVTVTNSTKAFTAAGNLTITRGNFITEAVDAGYIVSGNVSVAANGTWTHNVDWDTANLQFNIGGNIAIDGAYGIGAAARAHVQMTGSGKTIHTGTSAMNILTMNTTGTITADGPLTVNNNFWAMIGIGGGSFSTNGQTVVANGAFLNSGGTVNINGGSLSVIGGMNCGMNPGVAGNIVLSSGTLTTDGLTIGASGAINGVFSQTGGTLNVNGNVTIVSTTPASTFTCANSPAINISGNWANNGTYTKATETITFNGTSVISGSATNSFHNVTISGALTAPASNMNVSGTWSNNGTFTNNSGTVTFNGSSQQNIGGTAATTFHNATISNAAGAILGANQNVDNILSLTGGNLNISTKTLTMGATAPAISGTFSATRMIIADGGGEVRKSATSNGTASYTFPIGDNTGTAEYSPIALATTGSAYSNAYVGVSVNDAKHPNNSSTTNFLTRYWNVNQSGITSCLTNITGTYINAIADVSGTLGSIKAAQLNGTFNQSSNPWVKGSVLSGATLTYTGAPITAGQASVFSGITNADPTVTITGGGVTVCQNAGVTLTAVPAGDSTFTYSWTGLVTGSTTTATASATTASAGSPNSYTVTIKDANGISSAASTATTVTVNPNVTPTFTQVAAICVGGTLSALPATSTNSITGTWSPALNNTATTTYTFTPTAGQCATTTTMTIIVNPNVTPTFAAVAAICSGGTLSALPTTSTNGITGTWSPALNNTATTTYTFTPTAGQCATTATKTVTVNSNVTPTFAAVAAICSGGTLSALPTTSTNGITGTWSPALNNTATTTYTFTPTAGQCATTATKTVIVNSNVTPAFAAVAAICNGGTLSALPTTSTNGITGTWSPALNNTATTTYTFTPTAGQCATTATKTVTVNSNVTPTFAAVAAICSGGTLSALPTTSTNGITGTWSPALNNTATTTYTFTPTAGQCGASTTLTITVVPMPIGGSIAGSDTVCSASNGGTLTLSGYSGTIVKWQSATIADFSDATDINTTSTTVNYSNVVNTTYYRAIISNGICGSVYSAVATVTLGTVTTWDGTSWSNGEPVSTSTIIFIGNYTSTGNLSGCTATVANNSTVMILAGNDIALNGSLTVAAGSSFILNNNASLLQNTGVANSGNIIVRRKSSQLKRQDYTLWSSPVTGQNLFAFSPLTVVAPTSRFYTYNTSTNTYNSVVTPSAVAFDTAKGYLIRMPNNHPANVPTEWNGQFTGVPHNGTINYTMANVEAGKRYNLVGNPYPSPIDAVKFVNQNSANITGALYFWRKTNDATKPSYCSWSKAGGGTGTFVTNNEAQVVDPLGTIQTGQGFFVEALGSATNVQFNNSQRMGNHTNQFFRSALTEVPEPIESNRMWLNVTNDSGAFCQTVVGYFTDATLDIDAGIDGKYLNDSPTELYSIVNTDKLVIQGRPVPFDATDVVPLGFKATTAGNYTIAIDHLDGLFSGSQNVYLKDNLTGTQQDLKVGAYAFTSDAGTFDSRFEIVYQNALGMNDPVFDHAVVIYKQGDHFVINSGNVVMDNVKVYDIRGRLVVNKTGINASETTINAGETNQVLIVKITSDANQSVTKKVVN